MMESVEKPCHPGYMDQRTLSYVQVTDTVVLHIDPKFEQQRVAFMARALLAHGQQFKRNPFPDGYAKMEPSGRCYDQAMELASQHPELTYCEGTMIFDTGRGLFALPHGWCCLDDGTVVDPTCWKLQSDSKILYLGIPIRRHYADAWKARYGFHGILDGHPELHDTVGIYADDPSEWLQPMGEAQALKEVGLG